MQHPSDRLVIQKIDDISRAYNLNPWHNEENQTFYWPRRNEGFSSTVVGRRASYPGNPPRKRGTSAKQSFNGKPKATAPYNHTVAFGLPLDD